MSALFTHAVSGVIEYLCTNQRHQLQEDVASPVVAYAGGWAYCPAGHADDHEWRETGGRTLATLREWLRRPAPAPRTAA